MDYRCPQSVNLGAIGQIMNPFVDQAIALGPTRVMAAPDAGYAQVPQTGLAGFSDFMNVFSAASFLFPE